MRARDLATFVALTFLVCGLFSAANVTAGTKVIGLDGQVRSLDLSKAVPGQLNYQGFLVDAADSSAVTATLEMTFRLFDSETKGAELWSETHSMVAVNEGLFQVLLGSVTPFPDGLFDGSTLWLQTEVGPELLVPRKLLVSVGYSMRTEMADHAVTANQAANATQAEHAVHADTATYCPSAVVWTVSGEDVFRETGKVGIGTASPLTELDVAGAVNATAYYGDGSHLTGISGTTDNDWTISGDTVYHEVGPVGIGTNSPEMLLDVYGGMARLTWGLIVGKTSTGVPGIHIYDDDTNPNLRFTNDTGMDSRSSIDFMDTTNFLWSIGNDIYTDGGQTFGILDAKASEYRVFIDSAGQVGIGTITPAHTLDVTGDVSATTYYGDGSNLTGISGTTDNDWTISGSNVYHEVGNVGIGTTNPLRPLHIVGTNPRILIEASSINPEVNFKNSDDTGPEVWALYKHGTTDDFRFYQFGDKVTIQNSTGNVGIGTTNPSVKLDVNGDVNINSVYKIGGNTVLSTEGIENLFVGDSSGYSNTTGYSNTFLGREAGFSNTEGRCNTFVGAAAGDSNTTGYFNTFLGHNAGYNNTEGLSNTCVGDGAGYINTTGSFNTYIGKSAGAQNLGGSNNIFIGHEAGYTVGGSDNRLYIDPTQTDRPLIWGDFQNNRLVISGKDSDNTHNRTLFVNGSAGGTTGWYNDSDERLKKNIVTIPLALQKVQQLRGVNFEWKDTKNHEDGRQMGFVAQEAVKVIPEVVSEQEGHYAMQYGPITALLVEALKEQQEMIERLETRIETLETTGR